MVTLGSLPVVTAVGGGSIFGLFTLLGVIAIWFMVCYVPKTSSKTFEVVEADAPRLQGGVDNPASLPIAPVLWGAPEFHLPRYVPSGKL